MNREEMNRAGRNMKEWEEKGCVVSKKGRDVSIKGGDSLPIATK
jgi:phage terminase Nu1 subunit (DNA packaging protein)